jgi:hypothetical protein
MSEPELSERPWEQPGAFRRDCDPDRGKYLNTLAAVSVTLAVLSICGGVTGIIALAIAVPVYIIARRDLRKMRLGTMDPTEDYRTIDARDAAAVTMAVITFYAVSLGGYVLFFLWLG